MNTLLQEGIAEVNQGRETAAVNIFKELVSVEPRNVDAWLWLGRAIPDPAKKRECFKHVLRLEKGNLTAQNLLEYLNDEPATGSNFAGPRSVPAQAVNVIDRLPKLNGGGNPQPKIPNVSAAVRQTAIPQKPVPVPFTRTCPACGFTAAMDELFCPGCGLRLPVLSNSGGKAQAAPLNTPPVAKRNCQTCGTPAAPEDMFCLNCGQNLQASQELRSKFKNITSPPVVTERSKDTKSNGASTPPLPVSTPADPFGFSDPVSADPFGFSDPVSAEPFGFAGPVIVDPFAFVPPTGDIDPQTQARPRNGSPVIHPNDNQTTDEMPQYTFASSAEIVSLVEQLGSQNDAIGQNSVRSLVRIGPSVISQLSDCLQPEGSIFDSRRKETKLRRERALQALIGIGKPSVESLLEALFGKFGLALASEISNAIITIGKPGTEILISHIKNEPPASDRWHTLDAILCGILNVPPLKAITAVLNQEKWAKIGLIGGAILGALIGAASADVIGFLLGMLIGAYFFWSFAWGGFYGTGILGLIAFGINMIIAPFRASGQIRDRKAAESLRELIVGTQW